MTKKKPKPSDILAEPDPSSYKLAVQHLDRIFRFNLSKLKKKNVRTYQVVESMDEVSACFAAVTKTHLHYMDKVNLYKDNCRRMNESKSFLGLKKNGNH